LPSGMPIPEKSSGSWLSSDKKGKEIATNNNLLSLFCL